MADLFGRRSSTSQLYNMSSIALLWVKPLLRFLEYLFRIGLQLVKVCGDEYHFFLYSKTTKAKFTVNVTDCSFLIFAVFADLMT